MSIDQVAPVERPNFDAKMMNEQFRRWVHQLRAELEREHSISELAPRIARMLASGTPLCLPPTNAYDEGHAAVVDVVWHRRC
jgi:hypothetical protein